MSGASNGGIIPSSAFSPSPSSRIIRESLIMLRVGRRICLRRATGDVEKCIARVGEGGADKPASSGSWSSHGSSGKWAPGRPLRTCEHRDGQHHIDPCLRVTNAPEYATATGRRMTTHLRHVYARTSQCIQRWQGGTRCERGSRVRRAHLRWTR